MADADPGWWTKLAAAAATASATLFGIWKHTHRRIDGCYSALEGKASLEEMNRQRDNIGLLFTQQRQDRDAIMAELRNTNEILGHIHVSVTRELGARPTREEMLKAIHTRGKQ